jgi:uncharacterized protein YecE (DUF72 family)
MATAVRLGTCSWADPGLLATWYPPELKTAESRLRYYAERFDTVEVNASYYAIPEARTAARWAERTPDGFVFHVKAFGLMTGHKVQPEQLPPDLRPLVRQVTSRGNVEPDEDLRRRVFQRFHRELQPLRDAGKLGGILMQYPPSFAPSEESFQALAEVQELLPGDEVLVEFRQRDWLGEERREQTLDLLADAGLTYVTVDAPRVEGPNVAQTVVAHTTPTAYVRFHGRNAATWNRQGRVASERFDHVYDIQELAPWVEALRALSRSCERVFAMFNTNNADQGPRNATILRELLVDAHVDTTPEPGPTPGPQETLF